MARIIFTLEDGTEIQTELDSDKISIGRHPDSNVVLPSPSVSAQHATIKRRGDSYFVQDLGTTNGTTLNGVEVEEAKLQEGDRLSFGDIPAVVQFKDAPLKKKSPEDPKTETSSKNGPKSGARAGITTATYSQSSGCAGFLAFMTFLLAVFLGALVLAHAMKYGRFLLTDLLASERVKKFISSDADKSSGAGKSESGKEEAGR